MRYVLVCPDAFLRRLLPPTPGFAPIYVVATAAARATIVRQGGEAVAGDLASEAVYHRAFRSSHEPVLVAVPAMRRPRVLAAIRAVAPAAPIVVLGDDREPGTDVGDAAMLPRGSVLERLVEPELARAIARGRVARILSERSTSVRARAGRSGRSPRSTSCRSSWRTRCVSPSSAPDGTRTPCGCSSGCSSESS